VAQPAESPISAHISAAAMIDPFCLIDSHCPTLGRRAALPMTIEADRSENTSGGDSAIPPRPEPSAICGGVARALGHAVRFWWQSIVSQSSMRGGIPTWYLALEYRPLIPLCAIGGVGVSSWGLQHVVRANAPLRARLAGPPAYRLAIGGRDHHACQRDDRGAECSRVCSMDPLLHELFDHLELLAARA
jgi:hypothetical protein